MTSHLLAALLMTALAAGCGKNSTPTGLPEATAKHDPGTRVAIVPGADLLVHVDLNSLRDTPIMKSIKAVRAKNPPPAKPNDVDWDQIKQVAGLKDDDIQSILISADIDSLAIEGERLYKQVQQANGACAVALKRQLPYAKVAECMRVMSSRSAASKLEELELAGRPVVRVIPSSPKEPVVHAAVSSTEKTLLIAFQESDMKAMIERDVAGQPVTPDPALVRLGTQIADGSQIRLMLLASDAMREQIAKRIDAMGNTDPQHPTQAGMLAGFISPLRHTKNIVLGAKANQTIDVRFALELNNASQAQQCAQLIQSFILPLILKSTETSDPENKIHIDDSLRVTNEDNLLVLTCSITDQDVVNWKQPTP